MAALSEAEVKIVKMMNKALTTEVSAAIQYKTHAAVLAGAESPGVIDLLMDSAKDEEAHAEILRDLIANYLMAYPTMEMTPAIKATTLAKILDTNITSEEEAIKIYTELLSLIEANPKVDNYRTYQRKIEDILIEEEQHLSELRVLQ
jgi:bacterioferritin (cytochrome b1)